MTFGSNATRDYLGSDPPFRCPTGKADTLANIFVVQAVTLSRDGASQ